MMLFSYIFLATCIAITVEANLDYFRSQDIDFASHYWASTVLENASLGLGLNSGCDFCAGEVFYHEPPPDDIMFIPPPPLHPSQHAGPSDLVSLGKRQAGDQCSFCNLFYNDGEQLVNDDGINQDFNNRIVAFLVAFLSISAVLFLYLLSTRRSKIMASLTRTRLFKAHESSIQGGHQLDKNSSLNESIANSGVHLSDQCFLQTNRDKNLTSPIISDHVSHKKTSIPSKYWAQPGSIIGRTVRRIPNEYEVPSSRTNSTGTSSAVYADVNNENQQRFFSPYNLHTYAEVREALDPNEHFHTSSNSSVMLSESNYDNAVYSHGGCVVGNGGMLAAAPNGSVQMSDFNSMRPVQSMAYGQPATITNHHSNQLKLHHNVQTMYEQPPQRAQVVITSNNQGVSPTLLNYKERIHNVI